MSTRRLALLLAAILAVAALAAVVPAGATAQDDGADTTETDTTETDTPAGSESDSATDDQNDDQALVAIGMLAFGALALGMTLLYLNAWRRSSARLIKDTLEVTGRLPDYEFVAAAVPEPGARELEPTITLSIRGPALVHVGRGARFQAFQDDASVDAEWAVDPPEAGRVEPTTGAQTTVTPARLGPLTVRATAAGATAEAHAVAVAAPRRGGRVPLVGVGYGGITVSIIGLTLMAAATAYGVLDGAALVAFASAVVGYFFVEARGQQATQQAEPSDGMGSTTPPADDGADHV